jgi:hypothetical protein
MRELVMKSESYSELLKEYLDGEDSAEQELFARYDRELAVPADLWDGIEEQIVPARQTSVRWWMGIAAGLVLTIGVLSVFLLTQKSETITSVQLPNDRPVVIKSELAQARVKPGKDFKNKRKRIVPDNPGVLSSDVAYADLDEQETVKHIEQTENLLRSFRNYSISDADDEVDVSYDKALSRRLLIENVVLRRDAEMKAKFPTKTLLADVEPLLIDIANLPDRAKPEDVRAIKERVQKTEIVAALLDYPR